jgi:exopolysaccharide biosynthesis protein
MKKTIFYFFLGFLFLTVSAFDFHKFYVAIYQVNYAPEKKMLQITSRIFVDDLNMAIEKKYHKKAYLATEKESPEDIVLLKKYLTENLTFKVNGQNKTVNFLSKEIEGDVLICYSSVREVSKIHSLEIQNLILADWNSEQQNIMHFSVLGEKRSVLFTAFKRTEVLKY